MNKLVITTVDKIKIPYGGCKIVAQKAGVSIFTVTNVLNGKSNNPKVLAEIKNYLHELIGLKNEIKNLNETL